MRTCLGKGAVQLPRLSRSAYTSRATLKAIKRHSLSPRAGSQKIEKRMNDSPPPPGQPTRLVPNLPLALPSVFSASRLNYRATNKGEEEKQRTSPLVHRLLLGAVQLLTEGDPELVADRLELVDVLLVLLRVLRLLLCFVRDI